MSEPAQAGRFVTLEGIEGVGKTTVLSTIRHTLQAGGQAVDLTREPGGSLVGDRIRQFLLVPDGQAPCPDTELLMIFAARAEHLAKRIRPALAEGQWVVSDRFTDATYAYQGGGQGIPTSRIQAIEDWVQGEFRPDLTVLLDAPVELALERARGRGGADRFERETVAFFERARATYLARARAEPERFRVIDARASVNAVEAEVRAAVHAWREAR